MKRKYIVILMFFLILLSIINSSYAVTHYLQGSTSVDEGEIRWGGTTKYTTQWDNAITMWNNYGDINIAPDTSTTYEDLTVYDIYKNDVTWSGRMYVSVGADSLELNTWFLDGSSYAGTFSSSDKQHTIGHELGHSLGLAHHNLTGNVLRSGKRSYTSLGTQDKSDYDYLWK